MNESLDLPVPLFSFAVQVPMLRDTILVLYHTGIFMFY